MIRDAHWLINDKENQIWASLFMGKVCYLIRHPLSP
jgi:hypothetical protein